MKHAATRISAMPPLPADLARRVTAGLRSPKPTRQRHTVDALLAARAFAAGFVEGADSARAQRRHIVGGHDEHWRRGHDAGQRAAADAAARYLGDQLAPSANAAPAERCGPPRADERAPIPRSQRARASRAADALPCPQLTVL